MAADAVAVAISQGKVCIILNYYLYIQHICIKYVMQQLMLLYNSKKSRFYTNNVWGVVQSINQLL